MERFFYSIEEFQVMPATGIQVFIYLEFGPILDKYPYQAITPNDAHK